VATARRRSPCWRCWRSSAGGAPGDEKALCRLGVNLTSDPRFAANKLSMS
jgi:hypothetical protein